MTRRIAIFENEFNLLKDAFDLANLVYFSNQLEFSVFETSQDFGDLNNVNAYDKILIDIDLSPKSEKDGISIMRDIHQLDEHPDMIVLTGHSNIEKKLKELGLKIPPILKKPLDVSQIVASLRV